MQGRGPISFWRHCGAACVALAMLAAAPALAWEGEAPEKEHVFPSVLPLGMDCILLHPSERNVYLMAAAIPEGLEGMRLLRTGSQRLLLTAEGIPVRHYPRAIEFRVTATEWRDGFMELRPYPLASRQELNEFLLGLRFQVRMFDGLRNYVIEPVLVQLIGMPRDVPYNERIYRVLFYLDDVPIEHRPVLEVLSAEGARAGRFHFDLLF